MVPPPPPPPEAAAGAGAGGGLGRLLRGLFDLLGLGGKAAAVKAGSLASGTAEHDCFSIGDTARQKSDGAAVGGRSRAEE